MKKRGEKEKSIFGRAKRRNSRSLEKKRESEKKKAKAHSILFFFLNARAQFVRQERSRRWPDNNVDDDLSSDNCSRGSSRRRQQNRKQQQEKEGLEGPPFLYIYTFKTSVEGERKRAKRRKRLLQKNKKKKKKDFSSIKMQKWSLGRCFFFLLQC